MQRQVHVFDRRGKLYYHITLPTPEFPHDERLSGTRALQVPELTNSLFLVVCCKYIEDTEPGCCRSGMPQESYWPYCHVGTHLQLCGQRPQGTLHRVKQVSRYFCSVQRLHPACQAVITATMLSHCTSQHSRCLYRHKRHASLRGQQVSRFWQWAPPRATWCCTTLPGFRRCQSWGSTHALWHVQLGTTGTSWHWGLQISRYLIASWSRVCMPDDKLAVVRDMKMLQVQHDFGQDTAWKPELCYIILAACLYVVR